MCGLCVIILCDNLFINIFRSQFDFDAIISLMDAVNIQPGTMMGERASIAN